MLSTRVISAAILLPIAALVVYLGGWAMFGAMLLVGMLAAYEYVTMLRSKERRLSYVLTMAFAALLIADGQWSQLGLARWGLLAFPLGILVAEVFHGNRSGSLHDWATSVTGAIYVGYTLSFFVRLRALDQGIYWIIVAFVSTWVCDTGAYFVGSAIGKHKLCPKISPKKTWEGAIGGLISGVLTAILLSKWLLNVPMGWGILLGLAIVLAATFGDLAESVIKRQVNVKDSSHLIPGHGGMLDRVDSLLFVVPTVYAASRFLLPLIG